MSYRVAESFGYIKRPIKTWFLYPVFLVFQSTAPSQAPYYLSKGTVRLIAGHLLAIRLTKIDLAFRSIMHFNLINFVATTFALLPIIFVNNHAALAIPNPGSGSGSGSGSASNGPPQGGGSSGSGNQGGGGGSGGGGGNHGGTTQPVTGPGVFFAANTLSGVGTYTADSKVQGSFDQLKHWALDNVCNDLFPLTREYQDLLHGATVYCINTKHEPDRSVADQQAYFSSQCPPLIPGAWWNYDGSLSHPIP